jgi:hypothetical protein
MNDHNAPFEMFDVVNTFGVVVDASLGRDAKARTVLAVYRHNGRISLL